MLPKTGNLCEIANWRPIAILPILYKLFARMVYHRISPTLLAHQSQDQFGFTPGVRIEDALMVAECVIAHSIEFQVLVWLVSLDLRKAFDRVEHRALFEALNRCDLPDCYIALIEQLYSHQRGSANGSDSFQINRGVKQGDVLSSILFNCVLDHAIAKWKLRIGNCGLLVQPATERLTNSRYADDIFVYAKSLNEAIFMMETLVEELAKVGLSLNADKTKILRGPIEDDGFDVSFVHIASDLVEVLDVQSSHKYLGKQLTLRLHERSQCEVKHRIQRAWASFHKHRKVLQNQHIPLHLKLKFFDSLVTPAALFAVAVMPLSKSQLEAFCVVQRKMVRRIVGWRRVADESWRDTMVRMNARVAQAMQIFPIQSWDECIFRAKWRFACHVAQSTPHSWMKRVCYLSTSPTHDAAHGFFPHRGRGRPRIRWDDSLTAFSNEFFNSLNHWVDEIVPYCNDVHIEDAFCEYCSNS